MLYLKYKLIIIISVAILCALIYDYCRNSPKELPNVNGPTKTPLKKTEIRSKEIVVLGKPEKQFLMATNLYEDFGKDTEKAEQKYVGKTFVIEGQIGEVFVLKEHDSVAGIMLFSETVENFPDFPERKIDFSVLPYLRLVDSNESALLEEKRAYLWYSSPDFSHYSEDFSYRSFFGGVYCMFSTNFLHKPDPSGPERKKRIEIKCQIKGYKKGGIEEITKYSYSGEDRKEKVKSKPRVIAVGCVEISHE